MQTPTTQIVDQAIVGLEAEEAANADAKDTKGVSDDKTIETKDATKDDSADKSGTGADDKSSGGSDKDDAKEEPPKPKYDKNGKRIEEPAKPEKEVEKEEEGKFTADDAEEVKTPDASDKPATPTDNAGIQLSPTESKYIADNIGEPIVIRGVRGTGDDAKEVEIKAYSPNDIPSDFKFANDQQMLAAQTGFFNLEKKANDLLGNFRQNQSQAAAQDFERRENEGIKSDVVDLQKEGKFPKFKVRPNDPGFDDTAEAKQMAEVLTVMTERNEMYLKQYEQGRPYKHIGFAEAFDIWEKTNPERQAAAKADDAQKKEDAERKQINDRGASNRGMDSSNIVKPTVKPGTTTRDLLNRIDNDEF